jgi:hypothetical protein
LLSALDDWLRYSRASWEAAGSPQTLDPSLLFADPIAHNRASYHWLVARYRQPFHDLYQDIAPDGAVLSQQPPYFIAQWASYYDPITIWKQVSPLFVFAQALGGIDKRHVELARAYTLGYGIPVMAIDRMLDGLPGTPHARDTWLFALASYALGLEQIQKAKAPESVLSCFLSHTQQMFHFFWNEERLRYQLPEAVTADVLSEYLAGNSRLLSSIFLPVTISWALVLAKGQVPADFAPALAALRRVRQLNDELVDADDDIRYGIVTYPYLHGLASDRAGELAQNIRATWELDRSEPGSPGALGLTQQRRQLLRDSGSFAATAQSSLGFLRTAMHAVMRHVPAAAGFDVSLLLNQRLSHLLRLAQNDWKDLPQVYQPEPFVDQAMNAAAVPIAAAG